MAYTPISQVKTGGYVPIGSKTRNTPVDPNSLPLPDFNTSQSSTAISSDRPVGGKLLIPSIGKSVVQGTARGALATGTFLGSKALGEDTPTASRREYTPISRFEKAIFGEEPVSVKSEGIDPLISLGVSAEKAEKFGPIAVGGLTAADLFTGGGKSSALKTSIKNVDNLADAGKLLNQFDLADDVVFGLKLNNKIVEAKTPKQVDKVFREIEQAVKAPTPKPSTKKVDIQPPSPTRLTPSTRAAGDVLTPTAPLSKTPTTRRPQFTPKVVRSVSEVEPIFKGTEVPVTQLSRLAKNSLENNKTGIRPTSITKQSDDIVSGKSTRPVEIRVIEDGSIDIVDGRHILEAARRNNVENINFKDVTSEFFPDGVQVTKPPVLPQLPEDIKRILRARDADRGAAQNLINQRYAGATAPKGDSALAAAAKKPGNVAGVKKLTADLLVPISSRLERINPELKKVLRKFEFQVANKTTEDAAGVAPLLQATKNMTKEDQGIFDLARKNGDSEVIDELATKYDLHDELNQTRDVLDGLFQRAKDVGMDVEYRGDYFPRMVTNPEKFMAYLRGREDWGVINRMIEEEAFKKGKKVWDLTDEEKSGIVNNFIRGYGDKVTLSKPGFTKGRKLEVLDEELNQFYESADSALSAYVIRMNDEIEGRRFFGKEINTAEDIGDKDLLDSVGSYVTKLVADGDIKPQQEKEVADMFKARFNRGQMNGALDVYRNAEYISTMGSPTSAITQIGDLAFSAYENGLYHTARGIKKSFSKNKLSKEDVGVENIIQEFSNNTVPAKMLEKVFKATGLEKMDRLGKETLMNGTLSKMQVAAKKNDPALKTELERYFGPDEARLAMQELVEGLYTPRTKEIAFNKLLDFQPVAKSEMPQKYLEMPNGRIFYMLKSFTIKQFDVFRREALDDIVSGDPKKVKQGMKNLMRLSAMFIAANATADEIKDLMLGRETEMSDKVVDNIWRLVGATKYDVYKARTDGVARTVQGKLLFPTSIIDRAGKDIYNVANDKEYSKGPLKGEGYKLESAQTVPVAGKLYYWWFGRGAQKQESKEGDTPEQQGLPTLPKTGGVTTPELPALPKLPKL